MSKTASSLGVRLGPLNLPVAGGGYFRLLPYWWTRWGIGRVNRLEGQAGQGGDAEEPGGFYSPILGHD